MTKGKFFPLKNKCIPLLLNIRCRTRHHFHETWLCQTSSSTISELQIHVPDTLSPTLLSKITIKEEMGTRFKQRPDHQISSI
jgi:hypothetical protein